MKIIDRVVLAVFVLVLIVLCFFQRCALDIYFLVFGFGVAAMCGVAMYLQSRKTKKKDEKND